MAKSREELESSVPDDLKGTPFVDSAFLRITKDRGSAYYSEVPDIIELAGKLRDEYGQESLTTQEVTIPLPRSAEDELTDEMLLDRIRPWVELVREKVFGHTDPPFRSVSEAVEWIEGTAKRQQEDRISAEEREAAHKEIWRLAQRMGVGVGINIENLPYQREDDEWVHRVGCRPGDLWYLATETKRMAAATGFAQDALVMHVLINQPVQQSRIRVKSSRNATNLPDGGSLMRTWVTLNIQTTDLSFEELRRVYHRVRQHISGRKAKGVNNYHLHLYRMVKEAEGPPNDKKVAFWEKLQADWNQQFPEKQYTGWRGLERLYWRTVERLNEKRPGIRGKS